MGIDEAIRAAIETLQGIHVRGSEALPFSRALDLLTQCVQAIRSTRTQQEANHDHRDQ